MVVNWVEIGLIVGLNVAILFGFGLYAIRRVKHEAGEWAGAAIGRFWQSLTEKAAEEEGGSSSGSSTGAFELGGFKIDADMLKTIMELVKVAQSFGFLKGLGGGGATANPFLKP